MIDRETGNTVTVRTEGDSGPYIAISSGQLDRVTNELNSHRLGYEVQSDAVNLGDNPEIAVVNLGLGADPDQIQAILDSIPD